MATLQQKLAEQIPLNRQKVKAFSKEHCAKQISTVTVAQLLGGLRGVLGLLCDTSLVEPDKGLIIRGYPLLDIKDKWPEEIFFCLLTGEFPDDEAKKTLQQDLDKRSYVPEYVWDVLASMPEDSHPMAMLNTAVLVLERESVFRKMYSEGMTKDQYWIPALEDGLHILAKIPSIAAGIYRMRYGKGDVIPWTPGLDLGANYANMLGVSDPTGDFAKLMRLYLTFHCDHEGGNVSAYTCFTVASALSDPYYAVSAGLNGLAGPLHGLANQECLNWILELMEKFDGVPTPEQIDKNTRETLAAGKVVPGYGHAVLRVTDPRFAGFLAFGKEHIPEDPVFKTVATVFDVVPKVLKEFPKIKNPWPNVDAGSGSLLYHYGLREFEYYTVLFSVSRVMGMISQLILHRGIGTAINRPKSIEFNKLTNLV